MENSSSFLFSFPTEYFLNWYQTWTSKIHQLIAKDHQYGQYTTRQPQSTFSRIRKENKLNRPIKESDWKESKWNTKPKTKETKLNDNNKLDLHKSSYMFFDRFLISNGAFTKQRRSLFWRSRRRWWMFYSTSWGKEGCLGSISGKCSWSDSNWRRQSTGSLYIMKCWYWAKEKREHSVQAKLVLAYQEDLQKDIWFSGLQLFFILFCIWT